MKITESGDIKRVIIVCLCMFVGVVIIGGIYSNPTEAPKRQQTSVNSYDLQCLEEEISALRQIISDKDGKWNAEMIKQCQVELCQKEAALRVLLKKYQ